MTGFDIGAALGAAKSLLLSPGLAVVTAFVTGAIVFMPDTWAHDMQLVTFRESLAPFPGLVFLVALAVLSLHGGKAAQGIWTARRDRSEYAAAVRRNAGALSRPEWEILAFCLIKGQRSINLPRTHPPATSLHAVGLLAPAAGIINVLLSPWVVPARAWEILSSEPSLILGDESPEELVKQQWFHRLLSNQRRVDPFSEW